MLMFIFEQQLSKQEKRSSHVYTSPSYLYYTCILTYFIWSTDEAAAVEEDAADATAEDDAAFAVSSSGCKSQSEHSVITMVDSKPKLK